VRDFVAGTFFKSASACFHFHSSSRVSLSICIVLISEFHVKTALALAQGILLRRANKNVSFPSSSTGSADTRPNCGNDPVERCPAHNTRIKKKKRKKKGSLQTAE